jgi:hypothetical protein
MKGENQMKKLDADRIKPSKIIVRFEFDHSPSNKRFVRKPSDKKIGEFIPA